MMTNSRSKKIFVGALFSAIVLSGFFPGAATHAQTSPAPAAAPAITGSVQPPSILTCVSNPPAGCIYYASFLIDSFLGMFISMGAVVIKFALALNGNVFNSPTVQKGFAVTLALANLGFVIGIIIIALATILRRETYGIKQLLWKLVVMAILVNFGLVITAPILGFADNLSSYFLTATGGSGGATGNANGFVNNLTAAFQPQQLLNPVEKQQSANAASNCNSLLTQAASAISGGGLVSLCNYVTTAFSGDTTGQNAVFTSMLALLFAGVFETIVLITFWAIGLLLVVRYIYIALLLVLLPLAWLTWIFPKLSSNFDKWWQEFIRWTFFPAITLFFIYLAFQVAAVNGQGNVTIPPAAIQATAINGPEVGVAMTTGAASLLQTALDEILLCGLCIGGLFAANSMGIKGAGTAIHAAKWAGGQVTGYVGKRTRSGARNLGDRARTAGTKYDARSKQTTTALQRFGSSLQGIPVLKGVGSAIANKTAPPAIHGERKEDIKKYVDGTLKSLTDEGVIKRATAVTAFANPTEAAGLAQEIARRGLTTNKEIKPLMDKFVDVAQRMGTLEAVVSSRPDLMPPREKSPGVMETREEAAARAVGVAKGEIIQANPEVFDVANPAKAAGELGSHVTPAMLERTVLALTPAQLGAIGSDTSSPRRQERQSNITDAVKALVAPFKKMSAAGKFELDNTALAAAAIAKPELKGLEKIVKHMEFSPNWGSVLT